MTDNRWEAFSDGELETIAKALNERAFNFLENYRPLIEEIQNEQTRRASTKVWMKVTITGYYEADPADYSPPWSSPSRIAMADKLEFSENYNHALAAIENGAVTITVEPA